MHRPAMILSTVTLAIAGAGDLFAQAVQLPTFQYFSVSTNVSVPDRGGAYLGGVHRASSGRISNGVPLLGKAPGVGRLGRNDVIGSIIGASSVGVTATIIDHRELDAAVLADAHARRAASGAGATIGRAPAPAASHSPAHRHYRAMSEEAPADSVAKILRRNENQDLAVHQEAMELIEKGRQAEAAGKVSTAKIYYQMAVRRVDDPLRSRIEAHLASLVAEPPRLAASSP